MAGMAQFIQKSKLWQGGATSITLATVGHTITSCHTFVIFLMHHSAMLSVMSFPGTANASAFHFAGISSSKI